MYVWICVMCALLWGPTISAHKSGTATVFQLDKSGCDVLASIHSSFPVHMFSYIVNLHMFSIRFLLGLGVGGEYPLAATVTSESSSAVKRGRLMAGRYFSSRVFYSCV